MARGIDVQRAAVDKPSEGDARKGASAKVRLLQSLGNLPYRDQVAAVRPGGRLESPMPAGEPNNAPVQLMVDAVQMADPAPAAASGGAAPAAASGGAAASTTPTPATVEQRIRDILGIAQPPIVAGATEPTIAIGADGRSFTLFPSDSPKPVQLRKDILDEMKEFLALPEGAERGQWLDLIKSDFAKLRVEMAHARGEESKLVQIRTTFEKLLGEKATSEWTQGTACVDTMVDAAKAMLVQQEAGITPVASQIDDQLDALPAAVKTKIGQDIGGYTNQGFAGVVGKSFGDVILYMTCGSLVQRAQSLINFTEFYVLPNLMAGASTVFSTCQANLAAARPDFDLVATIDSVRGKSAKVIKKALLQDAEFMAKTRTEMDAKIPLIPVEMLNDRQLDFLAQQGMLDPFGPNEAPAPAVDLTGCTTKEQKIARLKAAGIHSSKAPGGKVDASSIASAETIEQDIYERAMTDITVDKTAYIEGRLENMVDPRHEWVRNANTFQAPLKAGISGTTARFVGAAAMLGADKNGAVVAMLGHLQAIEAHSFWEIVDGAGIGMSAGKYTPFPPNPAGMTAAATQFLQKPENGFADLGAGDRAKAEKVLLGEL